jgi:L-malate glycosyltransferase
MEKEIKRKKVLIAYKFMPQYRVDFFNRLKVELEKEHIDLEIVYGTSIHANRNDEKNLEWATYRKNKIFKFIGILFYWQPITDLIRKKDLVIVEQASGLLINYYLMFLRRYTATKLGFWGHGRNRQGDEGSLSNKFKKTLINRCDHWFAYTKSVKEYLLAQGYPIEKITVVNNCFDTLKLRAQMESITEQEKEAIRYELNLDLDDDVAIYCGALYKEKRLDFLLDAADRIRKKNPRFKLIIIGSGNDIETVELFAKNRDWTHYVGPKFDRDKALYFSVSKLFLMPGAVGLAVLDSFALKTPMILCSIDIHGPEVDYLEDGVNCVFCADDMEEFVFKTVSLFNDQTQLEKLKSGCIAHSTEITLEEMLKKFIGGIKQCLYEKVD